MLRFSQFTASAVALVAGAAAQSTPQAITAQKIPGAVKHAGIYHVSTGTWTRTGGAVANFGPDTIYSNTASSGYFSSAGGSGGFAPGSTNFDNGIVPGSTNTNHPAADRDVYNVNCVEIGYCDFSVGGTTSWELSFYDSYDPCTFNGAPDHTFSTGAVPQNGCWTVTFDLSGGGEFCLAADGGDGFNNSIDLDSFGWSYRYTGVTTVPGPAGFCLAGDPQNTDPGFIPPSVSTAGTNCYFGPASLCGPDSSSGLSNVDNWWLEDPMTAANSNCYFFGGYNNNNPCGGNIRTPYASWHMDLKGDLSECPRGASTIVSTPNGCNSTPNSTGVNSTMVITGSAAIADNDLTLSATVPPNTFGFFITSQSCCQPTPPGTSGTICVGSNVGLFRNSVQNSGAAGLIEISTAAGEFDFNAIPQATGPYMAVPGGTAHFQCWHRDINLPSMSSTTNMTDGVVVRWQ